MHRSLSAGLTMVLGFLLLAGAAAGQEPRRVLRGEPLPACPRPEPGAGPNETLVLMRVTIDRMTTKLSGSHTAGSPLPLLGYPEDYKMSDGSDYMAGKDYYALYPAPLDHAEESGTTLRYVFSPPANGLLYAQSDHEIGDLSAQGKLGPSGALVLEATAGSTTAVLRGEALVVANDGGTYFDDLWANGYTAVTGSVVPFEMVFTMKGGVWTADAFSRPFDYSMAGFVDFAHPVSTPRAVSLSITGPGQVPVSSAAQLVPTVRYENGAHSDGGYLVYWTVDPPELASIEKGLLTTAPFASEADLTVRATFAQGTDCLVAEKRVRVLAGTRRSGSGYFE